MAYRRHGFGSGAEEDGFGLGAFFFSFTNPNVNFFTISAPISSPNFSNPSFKSSPTSMHQSMKMAYAQMRQSATCTTIAGSKNGPTSQPGVEENTAEPAAMAGQEGTARSGSP